VQTGKLKTTLNDLVKGEITSMVLDDRMRKMYIGTSLGKIRCCNVKNGALIKKYPKHENEVSYLIYENKNKYLISAS
jgi:hypothetical protein